MATRPGGQRPGPGWARWIEDRRWSAVERYDGFAATHDEAWPDVLARFARALRPGGPLYLTVELGAADEVEAACRAALPEGLPLMPGEWPEGGYHYYPSRERVHGWLAGAGLVVEDEAVGHDCLHLLARRPVPPADGRPGMRP
jgi:hypothetical protein